MGTATALLAASLKADSAKVAVKWQFAGDALAWMNRYAWILLPSLLLAIGIAEVVQKRIGPPFVWETIHRVLDNVREDVFGSDPDPVEQHHRVTLFKYVRWRFAWPLERKRPPWSGWLVPVERSGHTSRKTKVAFWAPDNGDLAEGVAGRTWAMKSRTLQVPSLPDLGTDRSDRAYSAYAKATWVSIEWVRRE